MNNEQDIYDIPTLKTGLLHTADGHTTCLTCGARFEPDEVYPCDGHYYTAAKAAAHHSEILQLESGRAVACSIQDGSGQLFQMQLYMPDTLTAEAVREKFIESGDVIYKLVLAALTGDKRLAQQSLGQLDETEGKAL